MEKCFCYPGYSGISCEIKNEFSCPPYLKLQDSNNNTIIKSLINGNNENFNNSSLIKLSGWKPCSGNGLCKYGMCFCYPGYKVIIN
jgi:hypothetical protein